MIQALLDRSLQKIDDFGPTDAAKPVSCKELLLQVSPAHSLQRT